MSAIQLAFAFGALNVYAVDINADQLKMAVKFGAIPVDASQVDPVEEIHRRTQNKGVDVALELVGLPETIRGAFLSLGVVRRAVVAGICDRVIEIDTY